ncbi:methyltransferase family protein [Sphingoaurantiacus capsulatus]|uniref:Methyltransferase family protein n=1 Tax=Sphingoaurantiacus capsulatus TaxID=1771310 RepID=A0ABV7XAF7_9SPHN
MVVSPAAALLLFFLFYFTAAFVWPTLRLWRRDRVNALVLARDDSAHGVLASWFRGLIAVMMLLLIARAAGLPASALGAIDWLALPALRFVGWGLLLASLAWIVAAQAQMGASWRIGIEPGTQPPLVRRGLFGRSRNPIFLGMRLNLAGLFLADPNAATLAALLLGEALIQVQVRLEEVHLAGVFGADYDAYRREVPRWI